MKSATIQARKRFAADLADRDATRFAGDTTGKGGGSTTVECVPSGSPEAPRKAARTSSRRRKLDLMRLSDRIDTPEHRYRMRRWWLDRYTLDEIRELAEGLR